MPVVSKLILKAIEFREKTGSREIHPVIEQYKTFRKLLRKAQDTAFGHTYGFDGILRTQDDIALFQELVPLTTYEEIRENWWDRIRAGENNVCWPGSIDYFALSSGTSDAASKYIPVSKQMLKSQRRASMRQFYALLNYGLPEEVFQKEVLFVGGSTSLEEKNRKWYGDMSGITTAYSSPAWFIRDYFRPGFEITSIVNWQERIKAMVRAAPLWDIGIVCGIPCWVQQIFEHIVAHYRLQSIHDIWPHLMVYIHGGIHFEPYRESFEKLLSKPVRYAETYMASEGYFGYTAQEHASGIRLLLNNGIFFEFIPFVDGNFTDDGKPVQGVKTLTIDQVRTDVDYVIVISNNSGAWRYLPGDTIRFTDSTKCEIRITGRIRHFLSLCDEHVSTENLVEAVRRLSGEMHMEIREFTVAPVQEGNYFAHQWYLGCSDEILLAEKAASLLDHYLCEINDDYRTVRESMLGAPRVEIVPETLFYRWLRSEGRDGNQFKVPRVMKNDALHSWLKFMESNPIAKTP